MKIRGFENFKTSSKGFNKSILINIFNEHYSINTDETHKIGDARETIGI
jgi:hypothetical protein